MSASETLTIRLTPEVKERLGHLAAVTRRTKSFLAAEAIASYVDREAEIIGAIERGLEDTRAGRVLSHDEAMAKLRTTIEQAERSKA